MPASFVRIAAGAMIREFPLKPLLVRALEQAITELKPRFSPIVIALVYNKGSDEARVESLHISASTYLEFHYPWKKGLQPIDVEVLEEAKKIVESYRRGFVIQLEVSD